MVGNGSQQASSNSTRRRRRQTKYGEESRDVGQGRIGSQEASVCGETRWRAPGGRGYGPGGGGTQATSVASTKSSHFIIGPRRRRIHVVRCTGRQGLDTLAVELETLWALASATATVDTSSKESGTLWALSSATASVGTSAVESETLWALASAPASADTSAVESRGLCGR